MKDQPMLKEILEIKGITIRRSSIGAVYIDESKQAVVVIVDGANIVIDRSRSGWDAKGVYSKIRDWVMDGEGEMKNLHHWSAPRV